MAFPAVSGGSAGYLRGAFTGNVEAESIQNYLNQMHPERATLHAMFAQEMSDSAQPTALMDDTPINRSTTMVSDTASASKAEGAVATYNVPATPDRLFNRMQTFHRGVAASRTAQRVRLYGIEDAMDRAIDKALVEVMDLNEIAMHFSEGSNSSPTQMMGLMTWCAATGLERRHGTGSASCGDGLQTVASTFYSSMYNALGTSMSRDLLYDQVFGLGWRIGHRIDGSIILCGDKMMKAFADLPHQPGKDALNQRTISANDQTLKDILTVVQTPAYGTFYLMLDRFMAEPGVNIDYTNTGYTAGQGGVGTLTGAPAIGTVDQTILSVMPSEFKILAIDNIGYKELAEDGDYSAGMVFSEKTLKCEHLFGVIGGTKLAV